MQGWRPGRLMEGEGELSIERRVIIAEGLHDAAYYGRDIIDWCEVYIDCPF